METSILELAMGLALIFATLALLTMKVQESVFGNFLRRRVANLHDLVDEAVQHDRELADRLFANPLIFALSQGEQAKPGGWRGLLPRRPRGPSAIPPALFARALLTELNGGAHPELTIATPELFIEAQLKQAGKGRRQDVIKALQGLVAGRQADWRAFEAAVATWFADIGDRSEGWYKRSSDRVSFRVALALCLLLNVDALHIVNAISADPQLRVGLANLAEDVSRLRDAERGASAATDGERRRDRPEVRATARLVDANAALHEAFRRDADIAGYGHDLQPLREYCDVIPEIARAKRLDEKDSRPRDKKLYAAADMLGKRFASNSDGWVEVIPALLPVIEVSINGIDIPQPPDPPLQVSGAARTRPPRGSEREAAAAASAAASAASSAAAAASSAAAAAFAAAAAASSAAAAASAVKPSPALPAPATAASAVPQTREDRRRHVLTQSYVCLTQVSAWIRAASTASPLPDVRKTMLDAAAALEDSKSALLVLLQPGQRAATRLRDLFLTRPEEFRDCAKEAKGQPDLLLDCMRREEQVLTRLPIGWLPANTQRQFCSVLSDPKKIAAAGTTTPPWFCTGDTVEADPGLGLAEMRIAAKGNALGVWAKWLVGVWLSALFVSLGAPFWFDLLSRLVKLRNAGRVREAEEDERKGRGTQPPPSLSPGTGPAKPPGPAPGSLIGVPSPVGNVKGSRNDFEDRLVPREVLALQAVLGVKQTGEFDDETRTAIGNALSERGLGGGNTLNVGTYTALVRRAPEQAALDLEPGDRPTRGRPHAALPLLATQLKRVLNMPRGVDDKVFNDDLRALAVLYRVKKERAVTPAPQWPALHAARQARDNPAALDEIDEVLLKELQSLPAAGGVSHARDAAAPWMDWAWGELGQVEKNASAAQASNPRICEYLAAADLPGSGDATAWCAAFVTWVLRRHVDADGANEPVPKADRAAARSWRGWIRAGAAAGASLAYGDVVVVQTNPLETDAAKAQLHVGFYLQADGSHFWMLGGNQAEGGRVCLSRWPVADIRP
ncbi:MAG: hypothetical protein KF788_16815 [Piscinibacter sp.]|nr:hypothetical protein [Piscinibacter sp.]